MYCPSSLASLKSTSCLSKTAQTWREKPANSSDLVCFSGKLLRLGEKIRLHGGVISSTLWSPPEKCKESVFGIQILWWNQAESTDSLMFSGKSYRFFAGIRRAWSKPCRSVTVSKRWPSRCVQRPSRHSPHATFFSPLTAHRSPLAVHRQNHLLTWDFWTIFK